MLKNYSISTRLSFTQIVSIILLCAAFFIFGYVNVNDFLNRDIEINNNTTEKDFENLVNRDTNTLTASARIFTSDNAIKSVYATQDREALYEKVLPLYTRLVTNNGLENIIFIDTGGKVFLRMNDKNSFGDEITRESFLKTQKTQIMTSGLELGKTVFAIRVVAPIFESGKLLGYVEFSEGIDHFVEMVSEAESTNVLYLAEKNNTMESDYLNTVGKEIDTWDKFKNYVIVSNLPPIEGWENCVNEANINALSTGSKINKRININGKALACGGFPVMEGNEISGIVFNVKNMSERNAIAQNVINTLAIMCFVSVLVFGLALYFIYKKFLSGYNNLVDSVNKISEGNYDIKIPVESRDEVGRLSEAVNKMAGEIKRQRIDMEESNKRLILENNIKNEFISMASHELLTPTSIIEGYSSMILDDKMAKLDNKSENYLSKIFSSSKRLAGLVKEILDVSRIEQNRIVIKNCAFNLIEIRDDIGELASAKIKNRKMKIKLVCSHKEIYVYADKDKTIQILSNLINNAIKYSDKGTIEIGCDKISFKDANYIAVHVKDEGIGIPENEQKQLFQKFFRASNGAEKCDGGTGLGLYISREYARLMGGDIKVKSQENRGSTFTLYLKLATAGQIKLEKNKSNKPNPKLLEKK